ncbi:MAG: ribonuclease HII [Anaerolineaceae bacterium]
MRSNNYSTPDLAHERILWKAGYCHVGGIDEAGRGAWAGPVFAAVVVLSDNASNTMFFGNVRDSKQMTSKQRDKWRSLIQYYCHDCGVGYATNDEIDSLGIVPATRLAAQRALERLSFIPDALLLDYLKLPDVSIPQKALVRGDQQVLSIAAASILAKTERDMFMRDMDETYPGYLFRTNKGYGTRAHQQGLEKLGICRIHRVSFKPVMMIKKRHVDGV